jgi:prepilin peptidase CpaA
MAATILIPATIVFFPAGLALAASMDLLTMTIPNRVCAALAIGYFVVAFVVGVPFGVVLVNLSCAAVVLAAMFALFAFGVVGGGDAKLAAAISLWLGW